MPRRIWLGLLLCGGAALVFVAIRSNVADVQREAARRTSAKFLAQVSAPKASQSPAAKPAPKPDDGKLRIIIFGAHPDDAEYKGGGTAAKWARAGHHVKLVSVTNGDIGHWNMAGGPLAQRRTAEAREAARRLGVTSQVLDIHDGELLPTLENRRIITRVIREWRTDIVIAHRPWDYHPDHRYVGVLVQDAAFMVTVPYFCPDTPWLEKNPVFLFSSDGFQRSYPFRADIAVAVDDVFDQKLDAIDALVSQAYEGGASGSEEFVRTQVPPESDPAARKKWLKDRWSQRQSREADRFRDALVRLYGDDRGKAVRFAEAFEICEYGRQPSAAEIRDLFPFFGN
jgi:LmbE family N-acetylglucosaminyl deacetylase